MRASAIMGFVLLTGIARSQSVAQAREFVALMAPEHRSKQWAEQLDDFSIEGKMRTLTAGTADGKVSVLWGAEQPQPRLLSITETFQEEDRSFKEPWATDEALVQDVLDRLRRSRELPNAAQWPHRVSRSEGGGVVGLSGSPTTSVTFEEPSPDGTRVDSPHSIAVSLHSRTGRVLRFAALLSGSYEEKRGVMGQEEALENIARHLGRDLKNATIEAVWRRAQAPQYPNYQAAYEIREGTRVFVIHASGGQILDEWSARPGLDAPVRTPKPNVPPPKPRPGVTTVPLVKRTTDPRLILGGAALLAAAVLIGWRVRTRKR